MATSRVSSFIFQSTRALNWLAEDRQRYRQARLTKRLSDNFEAFRVCLALPRRDPDGDRSTAHSTHLDT
jgi:hypothetical protein